MVKPSRVFHRPNPGYPTQRQLLTDTGAVDRFVERVRTLSPVLASALSLFVATSLSGCSDAREALLPGGSSDDDGKAGAGRGERSTAEYLTPPVELARTVVAPVFAHGSGRGATGCLVVSPPAFLSEDEALVIIREELAVHGVELGPRRTLGEISTAPRYHQLVGDMARGPVVEDQRSSLPFEVDAVDPNHNVAVEYISRQDYHQLGGIGSGGVEIDARGNISGSMGSSVDTYDFRDCAEHVVRRIESQGLTPLHVGVFYDPMPELSWLQQATMPEGAEAWDDTQRALRERSRQLLKAQVEDFIDWLEHQEEL